VESISYSSDGRWIASVGKDSALRFWPIDIPSASPKVIRLESSGRAVAFHPKENLVTVGCEDGQLLLVDLDKPLRYLLRRTNDVPSGAILSVAFSPDGTRLVAGSSDGSIRELNLAEDQAIRQRKLLWVYDVALNRDGSLIAAASDHRAYLDPFSGITSARLRHKTFVRSVSFDPTRGPGEDLLLTSCFDRTVRLWSCADDAELIPPIHTDRQPSCAIFSPDGQFAAIATISGLVRIYHHLPPTMGSADRIATTVAPDGSHYARVHDRTNVVVFESSSNSIVREVSLSGPRINRVDLSRNGKRLLTRHEIGKDTVRFAVWGPDTDRAVAVTNLQGEAFAWWNPEGDCVVFHQTNALILWQPARGTSASWPWSIADIYNDVESRFSEASPRLVVAWGTNVMVLSTTTNAQIAYRSFPHKAASVDIDPTGTRVVVGESPPGLNPSQSHVWSIPDWREISPPLVHEDGIFHARFSPSGRWLILADESEGCVVYDTVNWKPIPLRQHFGMITDTTFSHDERFVATLTESRVKIIPSIRVWELPSGDPATSLMRADAPEWGRLKFLGHDASLCWSAPSTRYWHQWGLEKLTASSRDLADLTQLLSCGRVTASGVSVPLDGQELQRLWLRLWESHPDWFALTNR
jgi:WD40 repeat protein